MRKQAVSVTQPGSFQNQCRSGNLLYRESWRRAMFSVRSVLAGVFRFALMTEGLMVIDHDSIV